MRPQSRRNISVVDHRPRRAADGKDIEDLSRIIASVSTEEALGLIEGRGKCLQTLDLRTTGRVTREHKYFEASVRRKQVLDIVGTAIGLGRDYINPEN